MCRGHRFTSPVLRVLFLISRSTMSRSQAVGLRYFLTSRLNKLRLAGLAIVGADDGTLTFSERHFSVWFNLMRDYGPPGSG